MKLDRNINTRGKYAIIKLRELTQGEWEAVQNAPEVVLPTGKIDLGTDAETDFFVIRLKDHFAGAALKAYAKAAERWDPEWAAEVQALAEYAESIPKKFPD